jgi:pimeloyl-ACP methyl ester carboxylesterase
MVIMNNDASPVTRSQDIGDAELQYLLYPGGDPTIVMLHATGFFPWIWDPIAKKLAGSHRVVAPYFCDHREFDPEKGGLDWMLLAEDLVRFCSQLELEAPILVGHSMGATVMTFAESAFHLGAAGMVLIEPIFFPQQQYRVKMSVADHPLAGKALRRRNHWDTLAEVKAYLRTKPLFADWEEPFLDLYIEHGIIRRDASGLELTCPPPREAALFMGGMTRNPWPQLGQVRCPVLVIEGAESENRKYIDLEKAGAAFQNARHHLIQKAGHMVPMEQPGEIFMLLSDFIETVSR